MDIVIETIEYDHTKFGKPWIAEVDFTDPQGSFRWGSYVGDTGEHGAVMLRGAEEGAVVARGQKKWGDGKASAPVFYRLTDTGELERFATRLDAYLHWAAKHNVEVNMTPSE